MFAKESGRFAIELHRYRTAIRSHLDRATLSIPHLRPVTYTGL